MDDDKKYDVALSFAGEQRDYVKEVAEKLQSLNIFTFYDSNEVEIIRLWGGNLAENLQDVYENKASYVVMFISREYVEKAWTNHERRSALSGAIQKKTTILPVRFDDTPVPGLPTDVAYLQADGFPPHKLAEYVAKKLDRALSPVFNTHEAEAVESVSQEFVLFSTEDKRQYFIPFLDARWDSTGISLELLPETPEETALLRSMRKSLHDHTFHNRKVFALALQDDAAWIHPRDVVQTTSDSKTVWRVELGDDTRGRPSFSFGEMAYNDISPDQIAEMRARRILLNEWVFQETADPLRNVNDTLLDSFISGFALSGNENRMQVSGSPIPTLYRSTEESSERFLKFARLLSVLYLKLSYTVEDILQLDLDILDSRRLRVRFEGQRPSQYANKSPSVMRVEGICQLTE